VRHRETDSVERERKAERRQRDRETKTERQTMQKEKCTLIKMRNSHFYFVSTFEIK
jgi:hypothetical protein